MTRSEAVVLLTDVTAPLRDADLELITLARDYAGATSVGAACFTEPTPEVVAQLSAAGVSRLTALEVGTPWPLSAPAAQALTGVVDQARVLLAQATFANKEILARLAHLTGAGLVIDAAAISVGDDGAIRGAKRVFAGTWDLVCEVTTELALATVRPNAVTATQASSATNVDVRRVDVTGDAADHARVRSVSRTAHHSAADDASARPPLAQAAIVVAGGRGTGGDFTPVYELADALGAAVGSTRDCVDEGWIDHDTQVGQTGVTITPRLYIGAGISGAPHHRGGMQASEVIVAVNTDPECPLFEIADFIVVGDVATVLPQAAQALRERGK